MFTQPVINKLDNELRDYLRNTKKLTDQQIADKINTVPSGYRIGFVQSLQKEAGVIRAIRMLQSLPKWDIEFNVQQTVFNYLENNMGTSKELCSKLLTGLAETMGVLQKAERYYDSMLAGMPTDGPVNIPFSSALKSTIRDALKSDKTVGIEMKVLSR